MKYFVSQKIKDQIGKVFWIIIGWTIVSVCNFLNGYATLESFDVDLQDFQLGLYIKASIFTGLAAGILGGSIVVFLWERWLRTKNYGLALFNIFWSFTIIFYVISIWVNLYVYHIQLGWPVFEKATWKIILDNQAGVNTLQGYLFWLFVVLATLVFLQVNDKYGPGMFLAFILGKYFRPKREERIFMFLDLRSSTTIAEKLGEERYFHFLRDVFKHVTQSILNSKGEIYQYVGDEIVISWKLDAGTENFNCVRCFFDVQEDLRRKVSYYLNTYGVKPEFKAGLHLGPVMAGEMGVVKRDIAFSGDVLNTASRIQGKCNELGVDILLSKLLLNKLGLPSRLYKPKEIVVFYFTFITARK